MFWLVDLDWFFSSDLNWIWTKFLVGLIFSAVAVRLKWTETPHRDKPNETKRNQMKPNETKLTNLVLSCPVSIWSFHLNLAGTNFGWFWPESLPFRLVFHSFIHSFIHSVSHWTWPNWSFGVFFRGTFYLFVCWKSWFSLRIGIGFEPSFGWFSLDFFRGCRRVEVEMNFGQFHFNFGWILVEFWLNLGPFSISSWLEFGQSLPGFWLNFWLGFGWIFGWVLVEFLSNFGPFSISSWLKIGQSLPGFWLNFSLIFGWVLVEFLSNFGPFSILSWLEFDQSLPGFWLNFSLIFG